MPAFRINLIRNRPVPLPQRTVVALPLLLGLLIAGLVLAATIYQSIWELQSTRIRQRQASAEGALFRQLHPDRDVAGYRNALRQQLQEADRQLGIASPLLAHRTPAALILYTLTTTLPRKVRLLSLDLTPADHVLHFELAIPLDSAGGEKHLMALLTNWRYTPEMQDLVLNVREDSSRQSDFDGQPSFLVRYTVTLKGEE